MNSVPARSDHTVVTIKQSRCVSSVGYTINPEQVLTFLEAIRSKNPDASHHCWAYLWGPPHAHPGAAMSDDGEPSGAAGKPSLNVLMHKNIGDVMGVVSRYFGGIKFDASGLLRAYTSAAQSALQTVPLKIITEMVSADLTIDFSQEQRLRHHTSKLGGSVVSIGYSEHVRYKIFLPADEMISMRALANEYGRKLLDLSDSGPK